jgi:hypothetical protein
MKYIKELIVKDLEQAIFLKDLQKIESSLKINSLNKVNESISDIIKYKDEIIKSTMIIESIFKSPYSEIKEFLISLFEDESQVIKINSLWLAYNYALYTIKGSWKQSEDVISENLEYSYKYARDVIKGPFPKGESTIFGSSYKNDYIEFLKQKGIM